jgi:hypothetical protein
MPRQNDSRVGCRNVVYMKLITSDHCISIVQIKLKNGKKLQQDVLVGGVNCCWSSPAVIPGSESHGTRHHILPSHDSGNRATREKLWEELLSCFPLSRHGPHRKHNVQQFFCCSVCVCCSGSVFTEPLLSKGSLLVPLFRLSGVISHRIKN